MKFLKTQFSIVAAFLLLLSNSAYAQLDDGSGIVTGLGSLAVTAGEVVAALILFGIAWYLGKKVYMMTKA